MHGPFGWLSLFVGVCGAIMYGSRAALGREPEMALLTASVAAFVAGWIACRSIPEIERRLSTNARKDSMPPETTETAFTAGAGPHAK
jgi:hypothetical protein